jgi:hypothetical protein
MWKDLVDRGDRLKESPIVRHLIDREGSTFAPRGDFPKPERLDALVDPVGLFTPLPADSSQIAAIVASAQGHDFVLDGPPGTGKSQTIANMIAHNLALGRRVLFVAEKMAALDVVQRRLAERGLAEFCLELHSSKASKTDVLKQLDQAWSTRDSLTAAGRSRGSRERRCRRRPSRGQHASWSTPRAAVPASQGLDSQPRACVGPPRPTPTVSRHARPSRVCTLHRDTTRGTPAWTPCQPPQTSTPLGAGAPRQPQISGRSRTRTVARQFGTLVAR